MLNKFFGPSTLVAAAFVGPGTVTVCSLAGVTHGCSLLWALLFSVLSTIVLQEMAARLGWVTQTGLGTTIRNERNRTPLAIVMFYLVIIAILVGNAAYEAGNIGGAVLGLDLLYEGFNYWPLIIGGISFVLLFKLKYKILERLLIAMVLLMSLAFLVTAIKIAPPITSIISGFIPDFSVKQDWLTVMAIIGTTVVPYNLFLHASLISNKYDRSASLKDIRIENAVAIALGGIISFLIILVAAGSAEDVESIGSAADLAMQLESVLGPAAKYAMGLGLFGAGLTSAITAPLAAALAAKEIFNWDEEEENYKFRMVWMLILFIGVLFAMLGFKPIILIKLAQVANGLLLPILAGYLLILANRKTILKEYVNSLFLNILGLAVIGITLLLSIKTMFAVFQSF